MSLLENSDHYRPVLPPAPHVARAGLCIRCGRATLSTGAIRVLCTTCYEGHAPRTVPVETPIGTSESQWSS